MAERIRWLIEDRVIWITPRSNTTIQDLKEDNAWIVEMIRHGFSRTELPVHVIIDGEKMDSQPSPLEARKVLTHLSEPGLGYRVMAGTGNPTLHFFANFVGTINPEASLIFPTIGQALSVLCRKDDTLPDLMPILREQQDADHRED